MDIAKSLDPLRRFSFASASPFRAPASCFHQSWRPFLKLGWNRKRALFFDRTTRLKLIRSNRTTQLISIVILSFFWLVIFIPKMALTQPFSSHRSGQYLLRSFQTHACYGQQLHLSCPKDSIISIYLAHIASALNNQKANCTSSRLPLSTTKSINLPISMSTNSTSENPNAISVADPSLCPSIPAFTIISNHCANRVNCDLPVDSSIFKPSVSELSFQDIPSDCSLHGHYVEVVFHCKPAADINAKATCENRRLNLRCTKGQVLIIYRAYFGHIPDLQIGNCRSSSSSATSSPQFSNQIGFDLETCPLSNETPTLLRTCHGRNRCSLPVRESFFEAQTASKSSATNVAQLDRCRSKGRILKVSYTCASPVLLPDDPGQSSIESMGLSHPLTNQSQPISSDLTNIDKANLTRHALYPIFNLSALPPDAHPNVIKVQPSIDTDNCNCTSILAVGFLSEWVQAVHFIRNNRERLLLYFFVAVLFALFCVMLATVVQLWYKQRSIRRRNRKQSITITDEEHNQLLLNGSQTPQHDLMPRNALHPQHHMNATQLVDRNTRKDVNSNLLDGQRELNTSGKRSIDNSFDQDSLAAAFSTPLMQRRCSELAAAVTFHHFRHSPQPPTPIPASLATGIQPGTSAFTCPYPIKMIDDHHRTLISSSPNVASLTIPVLSTTGPVATPEPFVPTPDCRQDSMPADISFTPNRSIGNSSYQHHPHHLHHHSHGPESPTTPNMFTLPSTFSYVPSMAIQPNLVASESPAGPAKSTMTTPATMITSSTSISRDSAAIPAKMLVTHNSSSGQVVTSLANES